MKFTFDRDSMLREISIAQEIITNKSPISILSNILLIADNDTLTIKASDSSVNFITKIPVNVVEEGSTTVFCEKFLGILSSLPSGEVEFNQQNIKIIIRPNAKKIKFELKSIASDKFPEINNTEEVPFFELSSKDFKQMISQTIFAVSEDGNRYFMTGIHFEKNEDNLVMVATDGRRLSYIAKNIAKNIPDFPSAIVPVKILNCVLKNAPSEGNILIAIVDKMIFIKFGSYEFSSVLLEGQFPNYHRVIPENQSNKFTVLKSDLSEALKRTGLMIDKKVSRLLFTISAGTLTITSPESDLGTAVEVIPCEYAGESVTIALNCHYLSDPVKVIDTDNVVFEFTDSMKAITMHSEPLSDYFHIIMPMNVD